MLNRLAAGAVLALALPIAAADNPIVKDRFTADPAVMVDKGRIYLFTGHDEAPPGSKGFVMHDWRLYSSCDMRNWTDHGVALRVKDFAWAKGDAFAGDVAKRDGKYFMFVPVRNAKDNAFAIGVALASSPTGPYRDARGTPLVSNDLTHETPNYWDDIDPTVFIDDDGQAYLYWGNHVLKYAKLKRNMTELDGPIHTVGMFKFEEAPYLHKRGKTYYLSYSQGFPEETAYMTGPGATGPWTYRGIIMAKNRVAQTVHHSFADFNGKSYIFYHNTDLPGGEDHRRSVAVEEFSYNADGTIPFIPQTKQGPSPNPAPGCAAGGK